VILKAAGGSVARRARIVFFDFDGTVSLIRAGWMDIMMRPMLAALAALRTGESEAELRAVLEDFIWRFTGQDTIWQTRSFAAAVRERGGPELDAAEYKDRFLTALGELTTARMEEIRTGAAKPDKYLVPGTRALLEALRARGVTLILASGTDDPELQYEARLLDVARYFDGGVYGAQPDPDFSKEGLLRGVIERGHGAGEELIGFGDGNVEISLTLEAGGLAVGRATDEGDCLTINEWKCARLRQAGAQVIVPNYLDREELLAAILAE
jgi:phosphoglycolate phosphatase-like HAD superfamily hydrolase